MNINIVCVGKIKEKYLNMGISEFTKRLSKYCKLNIIEVADEKTPDGASDAVVDAIKLKEGQRIMSKIRDNSFCIVLSIDGERFDSESMAKKLDTLMVRGNSDFTFVIGGSLGVHELVLKRADMKLSFSDFTFPHQMMRLFLLEQIYRWFRINSGEPYHK